MKNESRGRYLAKNTAIFAIGSFATKIISFLLLPLYTNVLSTTEYGVVDLITTISAVLAPVLTLNIGEAVIRFLLEKNSETNEIMTIGLLGIVFAAVGGLVFLPFVRFYSDVSHYGIYLYLYTITLAASSVLLLYLRGKEKLVQYSVGNIIHSLAIAGLNILFLTRFSLGVEGYFCANILANCITILYAFFVGRVYKILFHLKYNHNLFCSMVRFSLLLIPNTFMWWIINSSDRVMLTSMLGVAANGIFAISYKIPTLVQTFSTIFNQAWGLSAIRENDSADRDTYYNSVFRGLLIITLLCGSGMMLVMKPFLYVYVAEEYYIAWRYTPYLIIGFVFLTLATFLSTPYYVNKNSKGILASSSVGAVTNLILNAVLIPCIGISGAAIATLISYIAIFFFRYFNTQKYISIRIVQKDYFIGFFILFVMGFSIFLDGLPGFTVLCIEFFGILLVFRKDLIRLCRKIVHTVVKRRQPRN